MDFELTPGTHWTHGASVDRAAVDGGSDDLPQGGCQDMPEHVIMLHDFSFKTPEEILAGLGGSGMHGGGMAGMDHSGMQRRGGTMAGMAHGNDRTLADPEVIEVAPGPMRLRIINGGAAMAFWIDPGCWYPRRLRWMAATVCLWRQGFIRWCMGKGWI